MILKFFKESNRAENCTNFQSSSAVPPGHQRISMLLFSFENSAGITIVQCWIKFKIKKHYIKTRKISNKNKYIESYIL